MIHYFFLLPPRTTIFKWSRINLYTCKHCPNSCNYCPTQYKGSNYHGAPCCRSAGPCSASSVDGNEEPDLIFVDTLQAHKHIRPAPGQPTRSRKKKHLNHLSQPFPNSLPLLKTRVETTSDILLEQDIQASIRANCSVILFGVCAGCGSDCPGGARGNRRSCGERAGAQGIKDQLGGSSQTERNHPGVPHQSERRWSHPHGNRGRDGLQCHRYHIYTTLRFEISKIFLLLVIVR